MEPNKSALLELYMSLFRSDEPKLYIERLGNISKAIHEINVEDYLPTKLALLEKDFPGPVSAYVCTSSYDYTWHANGVNHYRYYPVGIVLARHHHWDRDYYLNHYPYDGNVAGGPLEREDHRTNWFPIYRQTDLVKAVDLMMALHREQTLEMLRRENEGFLDHRP